jgi:hypothetical protein
LGLIFGPLPVPEASSGFEDYPGSVHAQCELKRDGHGWASWLQISGGASVLPPALGDSFIGFHVLDFNLELPELVRLAAA